LNELRFRPLATFSGIRNVPFIATSHNSIYPSLTVKQGALTIVVVRTHVFAFDEIEPIDARWLFGHMITIRPRQGWRNFSATFYGRPAAAEALRALQQAGAPLAPTAVEWL
jgi:hypothetical protein